MPTEVVIALAGAAGLIGMALVIYLAMREEPHQISSARRRREAAHNSSSPDDDHRATGK